MKIKTVFKKLNEFRNRIFSYYGDNRKFANTILIIAFLSFVFRIWYVASYGWHQPLNGDPFYYHWQGWMLAHGYGFSDPYIFFHNPLGGIEPAGAFFNLNTNHPIVPSAHHPPGYVVFIAAMNVVRLQTVGEQMLAQAFIGTADVFLVAYLAKSNFTKRVAIIAALFAAFYPGMWLYDQQLYSEQFSQFVVLIYLVSVYKLYKNPKTGTIIFCGLATACAALTRSELGLLLISPAYIICIKQRKVPFKLIVKRVLIFAVFFLLLYAPWVTRNMLVFQYPETVASDLGATIQSANCPPAYFSQDAAYENWTCVIGTPKGGDESTTDHLNLAKGIKFIENNKSRAVQIWFLHLGRVFYVFHPYQQAHSIQNFIDGWPLFASDLDWLLSYPMNLLAIVGIVLLKRKKLFQFPLINVICTSLFATFITFGDVRFVAVAQVAICIIAAFAADAIIFGLWNKINRMFKSKSPQREPLSTPESLNTAIVTD